MIAKLIAHAPARDAALHQLAHALDETLIAGVRTNVAFLGNLCRADAFKRGGVDTGYIDGHLAKLGAVPQPRDDAAAALGVAHILDSMDPPDGGQASDASEKDAASPWDARDGFQLGGPRAVAVLVIVDGENADASVAYGSDGPHVTVGSHTPAADATVFGSGREAYVLRRGRQTRVRLQDFSVQSAAAAGGDGVIKAPMHGRVLELLAAVGEQVAQGQRLAVIEAMKMEHALRAPFAGVIRQVPVSTGAQVVESAPIMVLEPLQDSDRKIK
jgi:3-methylcrotonyl-CoA carboxylase alpha subunit